MLLEDMFPKCLICTYMNTYCKRLLWCHIIDGFTVSTYACQLLQTTHRALKVSPRPHELSITNRLARGLPRGPYLHEICVFKHTPWYSSGTRDRVNHACESGHSLAGHCQVSLPLWEAWLHAPRWHLRLPNVVQSFLSKSTDQFFVPSKQKACQSQKTSTGYISFCCARVISTLYFMCEWQR